MYQKVSTELTFTEREKKIQAFWEENQIFEQSIAQRKEGESYTFYDGPPTANGKPHIGHVLTRVIKDMIPRYRTMKGYQVIRKAGWDTHGLPVELEVEKKLHLDGKEQIEQYGLEPFVKQCKESVWKYKEMWEQFSRMVGFWADMQNPYVTYHNDFIESEWWALKQIWEKGLLYKGFKIVPYCPRCGTPLSSHEVAQGYKEVKEKTAIAKFRVLEQENTYFLAWTTTPWTLPSNVALCVHPDENYIKIKVENEHYILAEALLSVIETDYEREQTYKGKELEYTAYEPLFSYAKLDKKAYYVVCDTYVTLTDGTGIVHIAPAFGEDDAKVGRKYDLPFLQLIDARGNFKPEVTELAGVFCKEGDPVILNILKEKGLLFRTLMVEHSYPYCWRCDTPLIYYARESWFIKMTEVRQQLLENNAAVHWMPQSIGKGRFGDWLENVQDWGISRDRYWGTPLNIWQCECGHQQAIGSIAQLRELSTNCPEEIELHRPFIDAVTIPCPDCGKEMHRVPEVIDCWFDSGAMPFAQWHYPFENKELFEAHFPADFISEAVDQTRGWFYSLLAISTLLFDKAPYRNVIVLGHVQDENGQKMSKSKGNAVDPFEALEQYGADAIRWYFYSNSALWLPNKFHKDAVIEGQRKFLGTLWNTYAFFVLYANIDEFNPKNYELKYDTLSAMDRWMLSRLAHLVKTVDQNLENYKIPETARAMQNFIEEVSNWYVRRSRERFWAPGMEQDKINAYLTLYHTIVTFCKLAAPMIPFMTEEIYQNLVCSVDPDAPKSIHLCDFPVQKEEWIQPELEQNMQMVLQIVTLGRACRSNANIKNRQPLQRIFVKAEQPLPEFYGTIIAQELNVKEIIFQEDISAFTSYQFKPQLKTLGKRFGKQIQAVKQCLQELDGNCAMQELEKTGQIKILVAGKEEVLAKEDLLIEPIQTAGYQSMTEQNCTVVLETNLTEALIEEGLLREIVSKVQTMRKEADFEVMDHIVLYYAENDRIAGIIQKYEKEIQKEVLAKEVRMEKTSAGYGKTWNLNGETVFFAVQKSE